MASYSNKNGQIFMCGHCQKIHLEFGNFSIDFPMLSQLRSFLKHLESIDGTFYENKNRDTNYRRKIMVPMPGGDVKILFNSQELSDICLLLRSFIADRENAIPRKFNFSALLPEYLN